MPIEEHHAIRATCDSHDCDHEWVVGGEIEPNGKSKEDIRHRLRDRGWFLDFYTQDAYCPNCTKKLPHVPNYATDD